MQFNSPPGWPTPPPGWTPPSGWKPDASWPDPPEGWQLWLPDEGEEAAEPAPEPPEDEIEEPLAAQEASAPSDDRAQLLARIRSLETQLGDAQGNDAPIDLDDQRVLQEVGIYRYHHPLEDAAAYKERLSDLNDRIRDFVRNGKPILAAELFTFDNSLAKGRRMVGQLSKLMLRSYNSEADTCVRALRSGNVTTAKKRLDASVKAIERLGSIMEMRINPDYHLLRGEELELTADYQMRVQEEREQARQERADLREQRRAEKELAAERERLEKERTHYQTALAKLADSDPDASQRMSERLTAIEEAIEHNDYRIANIRAGYVYVISNIGAFGPGIVKIGLTRRLEPHDRVRELGDASVPFRYDTHAIYFSKDAVTLENQLHEAFADRRVNLVNMRREFFFATPAEVREVLGTKVGGLLEFREEPEALEYLQSRQSWPTSIDQNPVD